MKMKLQLNKYDRKIFWFLTPISTLNPTTRFENAQSCLSIKFSVNGLSVFVISNEFMDENKISDFFKNVKMGCFLKVTGKIILSPSKEQKYEMQLNDFEILGGIIDDN